MNVRKNRLILAVTGASGALYAKTMLEKLIPLKNQYSQLAVIFSPTAKEVWNYELNEDWQNYPVDYFEAADLFAPPSSGSSGFTAMIVCPCSAGTLGRIAHGTADTLITRSADVMLKERRKLILVLRESPLNFIHIKNMELLTLAGAFIYPASPGLYTKPSSLQELINPFIDRILEQAGLILPGTYQWG